MKQCPSCQKVFEEDKRFCQVDGTPLIDLVQSTPDDPLKTVVGIPPIEDVTRDDKKTLVISAEEKEDLLQLPETPETPETFDPMKTVVISEPIKPSPPTVSEPVSSAPEPPKFNEPSLSPPSFGDLGSIEPPKTEEPPKADLPISPPKIEAPAMDPFSTPPPVLETPKFESTPLPSESSNVDSPFNKPISSPFDPKPILNDPKPIGSPFDTPTPFGQASDPFAANKQQDAWSPPPAPVQGWQDNSIGQNTPFQPPVAGSGGQNQTLGIVTLVLGIISLLCLGFLTGIPALITGYMTIKNVNSDPAQYGGKVLAIVGMVLGGLGILWSILYFAFVIIAILGNAR